MTPDASLFRWRKDNVQGETNDLVTDADVLRRAAEIMDREYAGPRTLLQKLRLVASRLESEPSTDGDMSQP